MKLEVDTIEQFFAACLEREAEMRQLKELISTELNERPVLFSGMGTIEVLAWNLMDYRCKSDKKLAPPRKWPRVALAPQKNYMAIYICAVSSNGKYIAEEFADDLGKVNCGKSCIRFKKLEDLNLNGLKKALIASKSATFGV